VHGEVQGLRFSKRGKQNVVDTIDASAYRGQPGNVIRIAAHDDFEVRDVTVTLESGRTRIETGLATRQPDDSWSYAATKSARGPITIEAVARDWRDHQDAKSGTVDLATGPVPADSPRGRLVERIPAPRNAAAPIFCRTARPG
jgi:hypothetical protein